MASAQAAGSTNTMSSDKSSSPKDLSSHFSRSAKSRQASSIKQFYKYFLIPGIGQLAGGLPNNHYFPFDTLEAKVAKPARWEPTPNKPIDPPADDDEASQKLSKLSLKSGGPAPHSTSSILVPHTSAQKNPLAKIDLATALQYGTAQGYPPLYGFLRQLTRDNLHPNCPYEGGPEIILTCGNTDGFSKVLQLLTNEWSAEKDWVRDRQGLLVEKFAYMNAVQAARPRGLNVVPVEIDDEGMLAEGKGGLRAVLKNWDLRRGKRPGLIYTVT
jgi:DNA-binding transcriptional MocR family regulator